MKKKVIIIVACIVAIILLVGGFIFFGKKDDNKNIKKDIAVNYDIVLRDDGTPRYVSGNRVNVIIEKDDDIFKALDELKNIYGFEKSKDVFNILRKDESGDFKYYRLQQKYNGVNVYGSNIIVTVKDNKVISFTGNYSSFGSVSTYIDINKTKELLKTKLVGEAEFVSEDKYIYCEGEKPVIVVVFDVIDDNGYYEYIVDKDGNILDKFSKNYNEKFDYNGETPNGNKVKVQLSKNSSILGDTYTFKDEDRNIVIIDGYNIGADLGNKNDVNWLNAIYYYFATQSHSPILTVMNDNKLIYYDGISPIFNLSNRINDATITLYNYERTYDYYKNVLGRNGYDNNNPETYVYIGVKNDVFGSDYLENAYWSDGYFVIGAMNDISLGVALDVVAHEYTHAVTQYTSGLIYKNESGALNEAYSDIIGSLIENKNFAVGEDVQEIRSMNNPNKYNDPGEKDSKYYFPTDEETYNEEWRQKIIARSIEIGQPLDDWKDWDNGGVHTNSGVPNHAAFLMYDGGAFASKEEMAKVWYNSEFLLSSNADFEDCAIAVIQTAKNFGLKEDKIEIIRNAFISTNMLPNDNSSLNGTVTDKDGNPIEGVLVNVSYKINPHVYFETYTDKDGKYSFEEIPCMDYEVTFTKSKYRDLHKDITINKDKNDLSVKLEKISEEEYSEAEIVFVLDISASMDENDPSDVRKQILVNMLSRLDSNYAFSLVTFAGVANVVNDGMSNKSNDKKILMTDIFNIPNDSGTKGEVSGTNGRAGLTRALKLFSDSDKRRYIVFFTDGEDTKTTDLTYDEIVEKANEKNIRILTVGLGDGEVNDTILNTLADNTNGKYYHATSSIELYKFVDTIIGEIE